MTPRQIRPWGTPLPEDQHLFEVPDLPAPVELPPPPPVKVKGTIKFEIDFEADVAALARIYPDEFEEAGTKPGYGPEEQGSVFLWDVLAEQAEGYLAEIPEALWDRTRGDEIDIEFRWTTELGRQLADALAVGQ